MHGLIADTPHARVFRVDGPNGPAALKRYKKFGASGEGSALPFLRDLTPNVGPAIYRVSPSRTSVLME